MIKLQKAIFRTLVYADVFDYPLTFEEAWRFLITQKKVEASDVRETLTRMKTRPQSPSAIAFVGQADLGWIGAEKKFFFLPGRKEIVPLRKKREQWSREKLKIAHRVTKWFRLIPWIEMIAVTGALAMENSDQDDDIDLLIVTSAKRLWLTRLLVVFLTEIIANRRRPGDKDVKDKICLNMFLDENHLTIPQKEQDLFSAHEVCQLRPLWNKNETYERFLAENQWVKEFLPNVIEGKLRGKVLKSKTTNYQQLAISNYFEKFAYRFQLQYMKSRRTTEITDPDRIRFHPQDARKWVLHKYQEKLGKLKIKK